MQVYVLPESAAPGTTKLTSLWLLLDDLSAGMPPNSLKSQYPESIKVIIGISASESSSSKRAKASPPSPLAHDHHTPVSYTHLTLPTKA